VETTDAAAPAAESAAPAAQGGEFRTGPIPPAPMSFDETLPDVESDDPATQVEGELVNMVQEFAMVTDASTTASCDAFDAGVDGTVSCTAQYKGISVPFSVDVVGGDYMFTYTPTPTEGMVASRDMVEDETRWMTDNEAVRCDMEEFQLVTVGEVVPGLNCYAQGDPDTYEVEFSEYGTIYVTAVL
jgi:hypothetical protein